MVLSISQNQCLKVLASSRLTAWLTGCLGPSEPFTLIEYRDTILCYMNIDNIYKYLLYSAEW